MVVGSGNARRHHRSAKVDEGDGGLRSRKARVDSACGEVKQFANTSRARHSLATCDFRGDRHSSMVDSMDRTPRHLSHFAVVICTRHRPVGIADAVRAVAWRQIGGIDDLVAREAIGQCGASSR